MNRWLILDDDIIDRRILADAVAELGDEVITVSSVAQAREQLKNERFDICLFDFYFDKEKKLTAAKFIAELREWMPARPIVITSNANEPKHIRPCLMAGADVFIPKQHGKLELASALRVAAISAKIRREMHLQATALPELSSELYLSKRTSVVIEHLVTQLTGNVVITGQSRTGKTTLAKNFALELQKRYPVRFKPDNTVYLDCAAHAEKGIEEILFGKQVDEDSWQLDLFERSKNGIAILDNVDHLSRSTQRELTEIFERGFYKAKGRTEVVLKSTKFVLTHSRDGEAKVSRSFLGKVGSQTIALPSISELYGELDDVVKFLMKREIKSNTFKRVTLGEDFCDAVKMFVKTERVAGNFSSLLHLFSDAILVASREDRHIVFGRDISSQTPTDANSQGPLDNEFERKLAALNRLLREGSDYWAAKDLVRDVMLLSARTRVGNNLSDIAAALGLSRAALYKLGVKSQGASHA